MGKLKDAAAWGWHQHHSSYSIDAEMRLTRATIPRRRPGRDGVLLYIGKAAAELRLPRGYVADFCELPLVQADFASQIIQAPTAARSKHSCRLASDVHRLNSGEAMLSWLHQQLPSYKTAPERPFKQANSIRNYDRLTSSRTDDVGLFPRNTFCSNRISTTISASCDGRQAHKRLVVLTHIAREG